MSNFNRYFQDELSYLRELGREFADAYPTLAPMLAEQSGDPDVERLLEGVAFLTGRIRQKLDDELPEAIHGIAELLVPALVRPVPASAIVEITPLPNALRQRMTVRAGTEFHSVPVDGVTCRFTSSVDIDLSPLAITDVRLGAAGSGHQLAIDLRVPADVPLAEVAPPALRLHFAGETRTSQGLLAWLHEHLVDVVLVGDDGREMSLGRRAFEARGFGDDEALLPQPKAAFAGYRLLSELFTLPSKFAFVDIADIARARELGPKTTKFTLALRCSAAPPTDLRVTPTTVKLHCVPVVNVFASSAEPIRIDAAREAYRVRPADLPAKAGEIYAIERVQAVSRGSRTELRPFFAFAHPGRTLDAMFYTTHLAPSAVGEGAELRVAVGAPAERKDLLDGAVLSLDVLATNGRIAGALRAGEISVASTTSPPIATFKNLAAPTPYVPPLLGRDLQWRVVACAAMSLTAITELAVLRSALAVFDVAAVVDQRMARASELRTEALRSVTARPVDQLLRGVPIRGVAIDVTVDDRGFSGTGDAYLFGSVLERFFAQYVGINSFSRTTIHTTPSNATFSWPPRNGSQALL